MCGIAGLINLSGRQISPAIIPKMTEAISHRGPDNQATWSEDYLSLGHSRLSIIDLSDNASQPMFSDDKRFVIIFNGEIYNYLDLRKELIKQKIHFLTTSDTEVLLKALIYWGTECLSRLNGMFTFALWDRLEKRLLIGRDRYGVKPLYIGYLDGNLAFASEQKAILASRSSPTSINKESIIEYFSFQNLFSDKTFFDGISLLQAGHFAILDMGEHSPSLKIKKYWDFDFKENLVVGSELELTEELERLLFQAVERQLVSDVEVGAYLSGGLDSSSITAIASKFLPNFKTFTIGFDLFASSEFERNFDESSKANKFANSLNIQNFQQTIYPVDMETSLNRLAWHLEDPRVGQSYPNYFAAKLASSNVKVVLSGIGGDELFGGYPWRYGISGNFDSGEAFLESQFSYWHRLATRDELNKILHPIRNTFSSFSTEEIFRSKFPSDILSARTPSDFVNASLYFEAKTFLHGLFIVEDKLSMAHGLESRVPFMDNDLVDFAMKCPPSFKITNLMESHGISMDERILRPDKVRRTNVGKAILRNATSKLTSIEISARDKQGFSAPDATWFKDQSRDFVEQTLLNKRAKIYNFFDYYATESVIRSHLTGASNRRLLIWSLLNFNAWLDVFEEKRS